MTVPYFTLTNITLGVIGAVFGSFPSVYTQTVGRISRLRKTQRIFSTLLKKGELTDLRSINEFLKGIGIKQDQGIAKLEAQGGVMFEKTRGLTEWIMPYDVNGKTIGKMIDTKEVSEFLRSNSDRYRNRVAFGFIALGYSVQILGLVLGMQV